MTANRTRFLVFSLVVATFLGAASWLTAQSRKTSPEPDSLYKHLSVFSEVLGLVRQAYVEEASVEKLMAGAYEGAADALGAFAVYVPAEKVAEFRRVRSGPAADSGLFLIRERGWIYVAGVAEGSAADRGGFKRGDLVAKVDGEPTRELQVWQIEGHLASHRDRAVPFVVVRRGNTESLELPVPNGLPVPASLRREGDVPILRIARFDESTADVVGRELRQIAGSAQLVIDLRGAAGGDPEAAYRAAELLATGELGALKSRDEVRRRFAASGDPLWRGDLVVLVDRGTLGAAEIFAAILDDAAEAVIVGEPTFGHAGHRAQVELSSGALLELTDAFYTGPDGELLDDSIEPDLLVDERSRTLSEQGLTLDELILRRGLGALRNAPAEVKRAA
jgi:carboxyl-terminal processing protease